MRKAFIETLIRLAQADPNLWLLTADLGFSVLEPFVERFPERYVNVGVAEQNMTGIAAGLALCGNTVFTYSIANFPTLRCLEQLRNDVCHHGADVKVVAVGGGFAYGSQGYTHHGIEDLAVMSTLYGMVVVAPGDPVETALLVQQLAARPGPCYLRLGKASEPVVHAGTAELLLGRAATVREGHDLTFISTGGILHSVVQAADKLAREGIHARVLSMHTLQPLDVDAIRRAALETGALITVEEHKSFGGLGTRVAEAIVAGDLRVPLRKVAASDEMQHLIGSQAFLSARMGDLVEIGRDMARTRSPALGSGKTLA